MSLADDPLCRFNSCRRREGEQNPEASSHKQVTTARRGLPGWPSCARHVINESPSFQAVTAGPAETSMIGIYAKACDFTLPRYLELRKLLYFRGFSGKGFCRDAGLSQPVPSTDHELMSKPVRTLRQRLEITALITCVAVCAMSAFRLFSFLHSSSRPE